MVPKTGRAFFDGAMFVFRGARFLGARPLLALLGALPPLIVGVVFFALFVTLVFNIESLVLLLTPFADGWNDWLRGGLRILTGALLIVAVGFTGVLVFSAVSLGIGAPIYERIASAVDDELGRSFEPAALGFWRGVGKAVGDALKLALIAVGLGAVVLLLGLIPVVGALVGALAGAVVGGRALAVELTGSAMDSRGLSLRSRQQILREHRALTLGFGMTCYLLFLVPLVAVVAMPSASAGASLLTRRLHGEPGG